MNGKEGAGARNASNASNGTASLSVKGDVSVALANLNYGIVSRDSSWAFRNNVLELSGSSINLKTGRCRSSD